jgi:hypothetical protein
MVEVEKMLVFVGAFSGFGGLVYRIPAPILACFWQKWSTPHQRGVGVRQRARLGDATQMETLHGDGKCLSLVYGDVQC